MADFFTNEMFDKPPDGGVALPGDGDEEDDEGVGGAGGGGAAASASAAVSMDEARIFDEYTGRPKGSVKACGANPTNPTHYFYQKVDDSIVVSVVISASNAKKVATVFNSRYGSIKKQQSPPTVVPPGLRPLVELMTAPVAPTASTSHSTTALVASTASTSHATASSTVTFVSSRTRSKSQSQVSTIFSVSDDQVQQICDFLCKPDGPLLFESKSAAPVSRWSISCKHFSTVLKVQMRLFKSLAKIRDEFCKERIDCFSEHADRNARVKLVPFEVAVRTSMRFVIRPDRAMETRHFEILSEALGAGAMHSLEILNLSNGSEVTPEMASPEDIFLGVIQGIDPWLGVALPSFARAAVQPAFAPNLSNLYLSNTGVEDAGLDALVDAAATDGVLASLRKLGLANNSICGDGAWPTKLSKAKFPSLKVLDLTGNSIGDQAIVVLTDTIRAPHVLSSLERLGLAQNEYRNDGLAALTEALSHDALPSLVQLTSIVNTEDDFFDECSKSATLAMKQAMLQRAILPRRGLGWRGEGPWVSPIDDDFMHAHTEPELHESDLDEDIAGDIIEAVFPTPWACTPCEIPAVKCLWVEGD